MGVEGEATQGNMDLDGQLTQEQFHSTVVGCTSNDFDDSDNSDDDQGGRDAMPTSVDAMPVPVHVMPLQVPTEVLHAMPAQGRLVIDLPEDDTPYDS